MYVLLSLSLLFSLSLSKERERKRREKQHQSTIFEDIISEKIDMIQKISWLCSMLYLDLE
jgi:hypothetical protein